MRRVGVIGTGVIGGGWAAHFLRMGLDVVAFDPAPGAEDRLRRLRRRRVADARASRAARRRRPVAPPLRDRPRRATAGTEFIQESTREDGPTKIRILAEIDAAADPATVIASSTSGFSMTMLQQDAVHAERLVVGHPFNPPYLIPLVEVVGGERTDPAVVDWTVAFYTHVGKYGLKMTKELPGFLGNRLQEAIWREALHMVAAGEATVEEIDASITYGPGLRWALMGPCLTFHLAGGQGGMGYMLDHFGAALLEPWTRLEAPELTPELRERMVEGCLREAAGRSIPELERERDEFLVELLALRARSDTRDASGNVTALVTSGTRVLPEWIDYNGHLMDGYYFVAFSDATEAVLAALGFGQAYRERTGCTIYTVEGHLTFRREVSLDTVLSVATQVVDHDAKRIHVVHDMTDAATGERLATAELMFIHVDQSSGKVVPMPAAQARAGRCDGRRACGFGAPAGVGRRISMHRDRAATRRPAGPGRPGPAAR